MQLRALNKLDRYNHEALMRYARLLGFGDINIKLDRETGLHSIIAVHSIDRGPAIGGCRLYPYQSFGHALKDAIRLAFMMTLKAAVSDLPHGGAKSVIMKPRVIKDRHALFNAFGSFVQSLNGRYITAMDVGTTTADMDAIAEQTPHVIGAAGLDDSQEDPSPYTAKGVFQSIQAAVKFKLQRDSLCDCHIAIQGAGKVGYLLAKLAHQAGAKITVCDSKPLSTEIFKEQFAATVVEPDAIYSVPCDVFAPCALGGILNYNNIQKLATKIVLGSANNQLAHRKYAQVLYKRGILYGPDFVVNAGGLIQSAAAHSHQNMDNVNKLIDSFYPRMLDLFQRAAVEKKSTSDVANEIALEKLKLKPVNHQKPMVFEQVHHNE